MLAGCSVPHQVEEMYGSLRLSPSVAIGSIPVSRKSLPCFRKIRAGLRFLLLGISSRSPKVDVSKRATSESETR